MKYDKNVSMSRQIQDVVSNPSTSQAHAAPATGSAHTVLQADARARRSPFASGRRCARSRPGLRPVGRGEEARLIGRSIVLARMNDHARSMESEDGTRRYNDGA